MLLVSRGQRPGVLLNCPQRRPHDENDLLPNASRPRQRALLHRDLRARRPRRWPGSPGRGQRLGSAGRGPDSQPCSAPEITASLRAAVSTGLSLHPLLATCGSPFALFGGTIRAPMCPHIHALLTPGCASVSSPLLKCSSDSPDLRVSSASLRDPSGHFLTYSFVDCPVSTYQALKQHSRRLRAQSCLTLCDPLDCIPPGSSVHGILQIKAGVGCHSLLQGIFPTQGSSPHLLHC